MRWGFCYMQQCTEQAREIKARALVLCGRSTDHCRVKEASNALLSCSVQAERNDRRAERAVLPQLTAQRSTALRRLAVT